jgi:hypothetical protein
MLDEAALKRLAGEVVYEDKTLEELDEFEDDEDEEVLAEYRYGAGRHFSALPLTFPFWCLITENILFDGVRRKRIEEMKAEAAKKQFGEVINITGMPYPGYVSPRYKCPVQSLIDLIPCPTSFKKSEANEYKAEINEAGEGIWVVLHLYQDHNLICRRLKQIWAALAKKFPLVKFVQSVSTLCIPNFPDRNLPAVFIYYEDDLKKQWIGPAPFGGEKVSEDGMVIMKETCGLEVYGQADTSL